MGGFCSIVGICLWRFVLFQGVLHAIKIYYENQYACNLLILFVKFVTRMLAVFLPGKSKISYRIGWNGRSTGSFKIYVSIKHWQRSIWISGMHFFKNISLVFDLKKSFVQIKSLKERESISTISRRTSKSVRALSMRKPKEFKMLLSEIWQQTKLLCRPPHLRNTTLTCAIQFGLTTRLF